MGPRKPVESGTHDSRGVVTGSYWVCERIGSTNISTMSNAHSNPVRISRGRALNRLSLTDRRRDDATSSTPFLAIMDRLPGFERPYEPLPTSYRTGTKAGTIHRATGDHWESQNAHLGRNLRRIQAGRGHQREDTAVLRQTSGVCERIGSRNISTQSIAHSDPGRSQGVDVESASSQIAAVLTHLRRRRSSPYGPPAGVRAALRASSDLV